MTKETIHIEGAGRVILTCRRNSRRVSMRLKSDDTLSVNYPWHVPLSEVYNFVNQNLGWIEEQRKKNLDRKSIFLPGKKIQTHFHEIEIVTTHKAKGYANIEEGKAIIAIPDLRPAESEKSQEFIRHIIAEVYRREARQFLPQRLSTLARENGFRYNEVYIKKLRSKWGSCSHNNNINLNLFLMSLPFHLIDYIILHELAHTVEHNHGRGFWKLVNRITNDQASQLDKEIKNCKLGL